MGCCTRVGWERSWVIDEWGGHCFVVVCRVVAPLHRSYGCHVALLATWPLYPGVRRGWRTEAGTYLNENDGDDVAHLPHRHRS